MPAFTIINNSYSITLDTNWLDSNPFKSRGRIVDAQGRAVSLEYDGPKYRIISKKERDFSFLERVGRGFLGTLAIVCSLGFAFFSKPIRALFIKHKKAIRFAELIDITPKKTLQLIKPEVVSTNSEERKPIIENDHSLIKEQTLEDLHKETLFSIDQQNLYCNSEEKTSKPPIPMPPDDVIKNGYGEYLVYRINSEGEKEPITDIEYEKIFDIIENSRSLSPEDPYIDLKGKIQEELGAEIQIAFIPRTIYELIFLKECIQEDLNRQNCCNAQSTRITRVIWKEENLDRQEIIENAMKEGFWQQCLFEDTDYEARFSRRNAFDYRLAHLKKIATRLNQVALKQFNSKNAEGFTYKEIGIVQDNLITFFKKLHDPQSDLHKSAKALRCNDYVSIAEKFTQEDILTIGRYTPSEATPMGIGTERHEQILKKAIQLESSAEAINSLVLYRGSNFLEDFLMREKKSYREQQILTNSLSYGTSLYAGVLYDGGATAFYYMRKSYLDAQAFIIPLKKQQAGKSPFHVYNVHPLIQMMSKGEIFHPRTKVWKIKEEQKVLGFLGLAESSYSKIKEQCKTNASQEKMEKWFLKYKSKAYLLAPKEL